jgi:hypothetical protein
MIGLCTDILIEKQIWELILLSCKGPPTSSWSAVTVDAPLKEVVPESEKVIHISMP